MAKTEVTLIIAERTVDSLFTFELLSAAPTAIVVSPHNNRGPRTPDHEVQHARRKFVFECKTLYAAKANTADWVVRVPRPQLADYLAHGQGSIVYVLPADPSNRMQPWIRTCRTDADHQGRCGACSNPGRRQGAVHYRRWAGQQQPVSSAPVETRLQPWFNHWAWCVRADALERYLVANPALTRKVSGIRTAEIPAPDRRLERVPGAVRLCHFLGAVEQDHDAIHGVTRDSIEDDADRDTAVPEDGLVGLERMSMQSVADLQPVKDDRRLVVGY